MASLNVYPTLSEVNNYLTNILHGIQPDSHFKTPYNLLLINAMRTIYGLRKKILCSFPPGPEAGEADCGPGSAVSVQGPAVRLHAESAPRTHHWPGCAGGAGLLAAGKDLIQPEDPHGQHENQRNAKQENVASGLDQFFVHVLPLISPQDVF
jgi:hypothetical protein